MGSRMGCVASKPDINDHHHNIFQVVNVDDLGHRFTAAKLQVTDGELILHQRGKTPTRWPLRCLRRYGFDAELFSFESGRRCPTGPGIYAFKCRRAEALFNILQQHIQNITEDAAAAPPLSQQPPLPDTNTAISVPPGVVGGGVGGVEGYDEEYLVPRLVSSHMHNNVSATLSSGGSGSMLRGPSNSISGGSRLSVGGGAGVVNMGGANSGVIGACMGGGGEGGFGSASCGLSAGGGGSCTGHNGFSNNRTSLSYRPSIDRGNANGTSFTFPDAIDSVDGTAGAGGGGLHSPSYPPAPLPETFYEEASIETPPTPGRNPPPTPTDTTRVIMDPQSNTVTYEIHSGGGGGMSGRPVSYPMCPQVTQLNSRPAPPYSNKMAALYEPPSRTDILYVNVHPDRHLYVNLPEDKRDTPLVPPRTSLVPPGAGCVAAGGGCPSLASVGCPSLAGIMRSNGGCGSIIGAGGGCGALSGGCGSLASVTSGCGGSLVAVAGGCGPPGGGCGSGSSHSGTTTDTDQQNSQINYIMVEVEVNSDSSVVVPASPQGSVTSGHESPHQRTVEHYAKIDIAKTNALCSVKSQSQTAREDGLRKTRHNFSFNPAVLTRNNSSLSD